MFLMMPYPAMMPCAPLPCSTGGPAYVLLPVCGCRSGAPGLPGTPAVPGTGGPRPQTQLWPRCGHR